MAIDVGAAVLERAVLMSSRPWMPFYGGDFIKKTLHLSGAEIGPYMLLIWHCWEHGGCVPDDDRILARIGRVHPPNWGRIKKSLHPFFDHLTPGLWVHPRVVSELSKTKELSNKFRAAAMRRHSQGTAKALPRHMLSQSHKERGLGEKESNGKSNVKIGDVVGNYIWNGSRWAEHGKTAKP